MKKISFALFLILSSFALNSCTSESAAKKAAIEGAKADYHAGYLKEMEGILDPSLLIGKNYINYIDRHTEATVSEIKMEGDSAALAKVQVESIPIENRRALVNIAARVPSDQVNNFNMGNALNLIEQQPGMVKGKKIGFVTLRLKKSGSEWSVVTP